LIVLDLECERGHGFEGWFASSAAFEEQLVHGRLSCPSCGVLRVLRRPSAPYVQTRPATAPSPASSPAAVEALTEQILAHLRNSARGLEDVGERFAEEARRIHHGDAESRGIKGRASGGELRDLLEEGISVLPIPPNEEVH
jgi:hypothetical protein